MSSPVKKLFGEMRRRKVVRVAIAYAIVGWLLLQVAEVVFDPLGLPDWTLTLVVMLAILGFPIAIALAWALEVTPDGVRRDTGVTKGEAASAEATAVTREIATAPSIAVLPFVDMSPDKDQDYFCEGMAEEILNALSRLEGVQVAARTSSFQFKDRAVDMRTVGQQLGVRTVLEGSVRKSGSQLRVTAQLINTVDGYHLWSERYDRNLEDVFAIQDEIATNIARALKPRLTPDDQDAIQSKATSQVEAYDYYLRGRQFFNGFGQKNMKLAIEMFCKAIEIDPDYAPAHAGLADSYATLYLYFNSDQRIRDRAVAASERAIELAPGSAEPHASRGLANLVCGCYADAETEFETAIALNPQLFEPVYLYARTCAAQGKFQQAAQLYERAAELQPEDFQSLMLLAQVYRSLGRHDDARDAARRGLVIAERHLKRHPEDTRALTLGSNALLAVGDRDKAVEWSERALELEPNETSVIYNAACFHSQAGNLDRAMELLESANLPGSANRSWIEHDSDLEPLRGDPRFQAFLDDLD